MVGFCFYLIAIVNTLPAFYQALTWLSFGVLASSLAVALLSLIGLRAAWRVPRAVVTESVGQSEDGPVVEVHMSNVGTLDKTGILIEVQIERISATGEKSPDLQLTRRFLMEALPSGSSLQTSLPLLHLPRGRYRVLQLKLIGSDTLGLFRIQKRVSASATFADVLDMKKPGRSTPLAQPTKQTAAKIETDNAEIVIGPAALARHDIASSPVLSARSDGGAPASRFLGQGEDVRGTRLYASGDDLRRVHWKSTARKGQLVVKEFHHTVQEHVLVVWDGAAGTRWGELRENEAANETIWRDASGTSGFNSEEWSLRLTASLCRALLENRRPCALLRLDDRPQDVSTRDDAFVSGRHDLALTMNQVSEDLADAHCNRESVLLEALQLWTTSSQPGEVFLVTASLSPDVARAVQRWRGQGARVVVALLSGAGFLESAVKPNHQKEPFPSGRNRSNAPVQKWRDGATWQQIEVNAENYRQQARACRSLGAHVVIISPTGGTRDFLQPLNFALQELLDKSGHAAKVSPEENAAPSDRSTPAQAATA